MPRDDLPNAIPRWKDLYIYVDFMSPLGKSEDMLKNNGLLLEWIFSRQREITGTIYLIPLYAEGLGNPRIKTQFNLQGNIDTQLNIFRDDLVENIPKGYMANILAGETVDTAPPIKIIYPFRSINWDPQLYYKFFPALIQPDIIVSGHFKDSFQQKHDFPAAQLQDWDNKPVLYIVQGIDSGTSGRFDTDSFLTAAEKNALREILFDNR